MPFAGFFHEQNRPDRDGAIQVVMENVAPGWEYQFEVQKQSLTYSSPYDYGSTMHYGGCKFGRFPADSAASARRTFWH